MSEYRSEFRSPSSYRLLNPGLGTPVPSSAKPVSDGAGWLLFCTIVLALIGVMNVIAGITALSNSLAFIHLGIGHWMGSLHVWGWIVLVMGIVHLLLAVGVWFGSEWARWIGALAVFANGAAMVMFIFSFTVAVLVILVLDLLAIYGLLAHGGRREIY